MSSQVMTKSHRISAPIVLQYALSLMWVARWLFIGCLSIVGALGFLGDFVYFSWIATVIISLTAVIESRCFPPLTLVLLFNFLFWIYSVPHIFLGIDMISLPIGIGLPFLLQSLWINALFLCFLMLYFSRLNLGRNSNINFHELIRRSSLPQSPQIFYSTVVILLLATFFGIKGKMVIGAGGYDAYMENLSEASGLQEYMIVPFFLAGLLIRTHIQKVVWYLVVAVFILKLIMLGLRVVALMGIIMAIWFSGIRFKFKLLLPAFFIGFICASLIGIFKNGFNRDDVLASLFFEMHGDSMVSHHGNVLWASSVMLQLIDDQMIDFYRRAELLLYYIANTVFPSGPLQKMIGQPSLGSWLQAHGYTSGGGHAAVFSYVAAGVPGVAIIGCLLGWAIKHALTESSSLTIVCIRCWLMMVLITFPRWISYDIGNFFFRLPLYAVILLIMMLGLRRVKVLKCGSES